MSKKADVKIFCSKCGHKQLPNKHNENWNIINCKCDNCGNKLDIEFKTLILGSKSKGKK